MAKKQSIDYMISHESYFGPPIKVRAMTELRPGDVVHCEYNGEFRYFFVLNALLDDKLHCISLRNIPRSALLVDIVAHMRPNVGPEAFYRSVLTSENVKKWDAYRTLLIDKLTSVRKLYYIVDAKAMIPENAKDITLPVTATDYKKVM